jgi:hypothetical protein
MVLSRHEQERQPTQQIQRDAKTNTQGIIPK